MSKRGALLTLGICLLAKVTLGGDAIISFARQSLGLDLSSVPFGLSGQSDGSFERTSPPMTAYPMVEDDGVTWMTNAISGTYRQTFPNRTLKYGFRNGRLTMLRVSINAFADAADQGLVKQRREELVKIQNDLVKAGPGHKLNFTEEGFRVQYGAMCAPIPESLFLAEIQITPVSKGSAP